MSATLLRSNRPTATEKYPVSYTTGRVFRKSEYTVRFLNSAINHDDATVAILQEKKHFDDLIQLREKFNAELDKFHDVSEQLAVKCFNTSLAYLSSLAPDKITVEVTNNDSLYFSIVKGNYSIYLEEYIDDGEIIVTMYKEGVKQNSISGNLGYVYARLRDITAD